MAILYAVVARGTVVLSEFSAVTGNTGAVARRILEKIPLEADTRLCFSQDRYIFHILRSDGLTFLCMANDTFGRRIPFSYLEDIHMRFMKNYGRVAHYAPAYAMNDEFSRVLHQQMEFFSSNPSADTLNRVRGEVSELRTIMVENIEKILERGDRIELLVDKTATMQDSSFHFRKQSKHLRRALWMKNAKLLLFLIGLQRYGKGDWRSISRNAVVSRTPTQVASHAQKYFLRLNSVKKDKKRPSIHDITTNSTANNPNWTPNDLMDPKTFTDPDSPSANFHMFGFPM